MSLRVPSSRSRRAFSLVEVALALGIVGFVLAGLIGAIPVAGNVGRQSIEQSRAAGLADTIFASLRGGRFGAASYLDDGTTVNLNTRTKDATSSLTYYAYFDEVATSTSADARRMHFVSAAPTGVSAYAVTLRFDNNPTGTLAPYSVGTNTTHAQANAVEISVNAVARPKDVYRFSSVIANSTE